MRLCVSGVSSVGFFDYLPRYFRLCLCSMYRVTRVLFVPEELGSICMLV